MGISRLRSGGKASASQRMQQKVAAQLRGKTQRILAAAAQALILSIRRRVARGVGVDDAPMPAYSSWYAAIKGRSGPRDLLVTGRMLASIVSRRSYDGAEIYISDADSARKASDNQRRARWFGVSPTDRKHVIAVARRALRPTK
jgi:hypothetical protein